MSWLSELFGGGDDSAAQTAALIAQREQAGVAERARQDAEAAARRDRDLAEQARIIEEDRRQKELAAYEEQRRGEQTAFEQQLEALRQQFAPTPQQQAIRERQDALALQQLEYEQGQREKEQQRAGLRETAMGGLAPIFGPEFERGYVPETLDDPYIASAYAGQRAKADEYLNNLLKRGVITQTGYEGGQKELEAQAPRVRTQLEDIGRTLLEQERSGLRDIGGRARETASTLDIGQAFDPSIYSRELETRRGEFGSKFPDLFTSSVTGDLFDVSSLPDIAGAAQGAQNLPYTAALPLTEEEEDPFAPGKPVQRRTSTVF